MSARRESDGRARGPFASVWFDCDSTLSRIEGIDELATRFRPGLGAPIEKLTQEAMDGLRSIESVYAERLRLIAPTAAEVDAIGALYAETLVDGAAATIRALQAAGKRVGIVSGGLRQAVLVAAQALGIATLDVHAVDIWFHADGTYRDFDRASPFARGSGKREFVRALAAELRPCLFVGDGTTDLAVQGEAELFVGFGGVVCRPRVEREAEVFVRGPSLAPVLELALTADERAR